MAWSTKEQRCGAFCPLQHQKHQNSTKSSSKLSIILLKNKKQTTFIRVLESYVKKMKILYVLLGFVRNYQVQLPQAPQPPQGHQSQQNYQTNTQGMFQKKVSIEIFYTKNCNRSDLKSCLTNS